MKPSIIALTLLLFLFVACSAVKGTSTPVSEATITPEPSPTATSVPVETVTFATEDNVTLSGTLFGNGRIAVILAHQGTPGADQTTWQPFARLLAEHGYTALTFDFRGVGQSQGVLRYGDLGMDVRAANQFLRERGYRQIVCAGASMGGTACIGNAAHDEYMGLIILASTMKAGGGNNSLRITDEDLAKLTLPKLFITADGDYASVVHDTKHMAELSPEPKSLLLLPGTQHGTHLFDTVLGDKLTASMLEFLDNLQNQTFSPVLPTQLEGTSGPIYSLAWSPDGRMLASAGYGQVKLWDGVSRKEITTIEGHTSYVWGLAWSPDGSTLASASQDGSVKLWNTTSWENTAVLRTGWAFCVSWSPDGKYLVTGTASGKSQIWDIETNQVVRTLDAVSTIISIAWSPDGHTIAVGQWDGKITLWNGDTGAQLKSLVATKARSDVNGLAWSPDGSLLASAHQDGKVRVWDSKTGENLDIFTGHFGWIRGVAWSPDGHMLASTGEDAEIRVWKVATGQSIAHLRPASLPTWSLAWSPDGKWLAAGNGVYESKTINGKVLILDVQSEIPSTAENVEPPLPSLQAITTANAGKIQLLKTLPIPGFKTSALSQCSIAFSPDGKLLSGVCYQNTIPVWEAQSGQLLRSLESSPVHEVAVAFSPDGKQIATGGFAKNIRLWDSATGQLIRTIDPLSLPIWELAFSPNGNRLALANFNRSSASSDTSGIHLWNASNGELLWGYKDDDKRLLVLSVDYSPDGKTLAYGTFDSALILDAEEGTLIKLLPIPNHVGDLTFSLDGKLLATGSDDYKIRLWGTSNYELLSTLEGHKNYVNGVAFSPDGKLIVSGSHDQKVGIWDVKSGQLLNMLEGHKNAVLRVAINPAGTMIASISWDGTVCLWGVMQE